MTSWGWRLPFLAAGPLGVIGLYLRLRLDETPAFQRLATGGTAPVPVGDATAQTVEGGSRGELRRIFDQQWPRLILCLALVAAYNVTDYMLLSYMPTYLTSDLKYSATHGLIVLLATMVFLMLVISSVGRLGDRLGRKPLLMTGMLGFFLLSVPSFLLVREGDLLAVSAGMLLLGLALVCLLATMSAALPALFPTPVRYGALSIGYNVSTSLFGGTTPLVTTALISLAGTNLMPAYYTMAAALVGVVAVACMKETAGRPLDGSPPAVATKREAADIVNAQTPDPRF